MSGMRVLAAMSGGVDSAVAAARAADAGHQVTGVHLALSLNPQSYRSGARGCCTLEDARDARRAADVIGIPFYVWDLAERFHADVVADFVAEYARGRTPNPCLRCNEKIKFAAVLDRAVALGFDAVCTGHHARLADGRLHRSPDLAKDQSYVLAVLTREQLDRALFPLGDSTKAQVRAEAAERGLAVAAKPDSHDVCFIPDGDTRAFLAGALGRAPGPIVDTGGTVVGSHDGAYGFTVGQRRGLRVGTPGRGRQAAVRAGHRAGLGHGDRRARRVPGRDRDRGRAPGLDRLRPAAAPAGLPGAVARARAGVPGDRDPRRRAAADSAHRAGQGSGPRPGGGLLRRRCRPGQRHHRGHFLTRLSGSAPGPAASRGRDPLPHDRWSTGRCPEGDSGCSILWPGSSLVVNAPADQPGHDCELCVNAALQIG